MLAITIVEAAAIVLLGLLVIGLLRSHADILRSLHELGVGQPRDPQHGLGAITGPPTTAGPAKDLYGETLDGEAVSIGVAGTEHDTLLAFLSASCYTCQPFWSALSRPVEIPNNARVIAVVQQGDNLSKLCSLAGPNLLVVISDDAWTDYQVPGSPHFVYLDGPNGTVVGEGTAPSWPQVRDLLQHAAGNRMLPADRVGLAAAPLGRDNAERVDLELLNAGIGPGHPSLYRGEADPSLIGSLRTDP
jgi:hypothetical protein